MRIIHLKKIVINPSNEHSTLIATDLSVGYNNTPVAEAINFSLSPGELTAIIGINGIGKSTLLRTLGNLQAPLSGKILVKGKSIGDYRSLELASEISLVLTEPIASNNMTVIEMVALGRQPYTNWIGTLTVKDKERIRNSLYILELETLQYKKCYELSDGQLQRVMIARALAQDTDLILLDEPTSHLDLYHKVQILKLLKSIAHKSRKTVLFTSHEIDMAIQLSDKILIMDGAGNPFGQPCDLIEQHAFENLFPSDTLSFDSQTGTFRIEK